MGIDTLGVMAGHVNISDIKDAVREALPGVSVGARQFTGPDVWIVEALDGHGSAISVTAYLNSYAASDYSELGLQESTMILLQYDAQSESLVHKIIGTRQGWIKAHDGSAWQSLV
jgi:hypothetical protein